MSNSRPGSNPAGWALPPIAVRAQRGDQEELVLAAQQLAEQLDLPIAKDNPQEFDMLLTVMTDRLELRWQGGDRAADPQAVGAPGKRINPVCIDLEKIDGLSPWGKSLRQPIARAVGIVKANPWRPRILDVTAGYGEDCWLLASLGCQVMATERCGPIVALLGDALRRAAKSQPQIAGRITLFYADGKDVLRRIAAGQSPGKLFDKSAPPLARTTPVEVVYLDPMFPPGRKRARQRKEMWLLRKLAGHDPDSGELFDLAMTVASRRVVVKRPLHAAPLAGKPVSMHKGRAYRYDIYPTTICR